MNDYKQNRKTNNGALLLPNHRLLFSIEKETLLVHKTSWTDLEGIVLCNRSQSCKIIYCMILFILYKRTKLQQWRTDSRVPGFREKGEMGEGCRNGGGWFVGEFGEFSSDIGVFHWQWQVFQIGGKKKQF